MAKQLPWLNLTFKLMDISKTSKTKSNYWIISSKYSGFRSTFEVNFKFFQIHFKFCLLLIFLVLISLSFFPSSVFLFASNLRALEPEEYAVKNPHICNKIKRLKDKNVANWGGQQDDRKCLQGEEVLVCLSCYQRTVWSIIQYILLYPSLLLYTTTGDSGPVQSQSEELCHHGETLWESPDRLV